MVQLLDNQIKGSFKRSVPRSLFNGVVTTTTRLPIETRATQRPRHKRFSPRPFLRSSLLVFASGLQSGGPHFYGAHNDQIRGEAEEEVDVHTRRTPPSREAARNARTRRTLYLRKIIAFRSAQVVRRLERVASPLRDNFRSTLIGLRVPHQQSMGKTE